ncbi:hypothetical protein C8R45DRAFT_152489 [Mycena sanguinolenta]|nr:hypothetical protein C8R45DRAFT_152489 [Mycena sanguinolenta]
MPATKQALYAESATILNFIQPWAKETEYKSDERALYSCSWGFFLPGHIERAVKIRTTCQFFESKRLRKVTKSESASQVPGVSGCHPGTFRMPSKSSAQSSEGWSGLKLELRTRRNHYTDRTMGVVAWPQELGSGSQGWVEAVHLLISTWPAYSRLLIPPRFQHKSSIIWRLTRRLLIAKFSGEPEKMIRSVSCQQVVLGSGTLLHAAARSRKGQVHLVGFSQLQGVPGKPTIFTCRVT